MSLAVRKIALLAGFALLGAASLWMLHDSARPARDLRASDGDSTSDGIAVPFGIPGAAEKKGAPDEKLDPDGVPRVLLRGRVIARQGGAPVAGAEVRILGETDQVVRSDEHGAFEARLPGGDYHVSARHGALAGLVSGVVHVAVAVSGAPIVVELDPGRTITGQVSFLGAPANARVRVSGVIVAGEMSELMVVDVDRHGGYTVEGLLPGRYSLSVEVRSAAPMSRVVDTLLGDVDHVDFTLGRGALLRGRVLTRTGEPVAGARIETDFIDSFAPPGHGSTRTLADGTFLLDQIGVGEFSLSVQTRAQGSASATVKLDAGDERDLRLVLDEGATIAGKVSFADGRPAPGAKVEIPGQESQATAASDGSYRLIGVLPGNWTVCATAGGKPRAVEGSVELTAHEHREKLTLVIPIGGRSIDGIVLGPDGAPLEGVAITALHGSDPVYHATSRAGGGFVIEDLSDGEWHLLAERAGLNSADAEVAAGTSGVTLTMRAPATVSGFVTDHDGRPVADFTISARLTEVEGGLSHTIYSERVHDPSGAFVLRGLSAGIYRLLADRGGITGTLDLAPIRDGETRRDVQLRLAPTATIDGRVVDYFSGAAIPGITVQAIVGPQRARAVSDGSGSFHITALPIGDAQLQIDPGPDYSPDVRFLRLPENGGTISVGAVPLLRGRLPQPIVAYDGIDPVSRDGHAVAGWVQPDSPAAAAGVRDGDAILAVNGNDTSSLGPDAINLLLAGGPGAPITLTVAGSDGVRREVSFALASVSEPPAPENSDQPSLD